MWFLFISQLINIQYNWNLYLKTLYSTKNDWSWKWTVFTVFVADVFFNNNVYLFNFARSQTRFDNNVYHHRLTECMIFEHKDITDQSKSAFIKESRFFPVLRHSLRGSFEFMLEKFARVSKYLQFEMNFLLMNPKYFETHEFLQSERKRFHFPPKTNYHCCKVIYFISANHTFTSHFTFSQDCFKLTGSTFYLW